MRTISLKKNKDLIMVKNYFKTSCFANFASARWAQQQAVKITRWTIFIQYHAKYGGPKRISVLVQ